jgi:hypothetical protein
LSKGHGLGEERLGGRCTEEREESGGASQIPMADGTPGLGRATGMLARKAACGSSGSGVDERGRGKTGTGQRTVFVLKSGSVARAEIERGGGSAWVCPCGGKRRRRGGA